MSRALNKAIFQRLHGDETLAGTAATVRTALLALLAADPKSSTKGAVFQGNLATATAFPCITFRADGGLQHPWSGTDTAVIGQPIFTFEVWNDDRDGTTVPAILDLMEQLLDERRGVANPPTLDTGWHLETMAVMAEPSINYDANTGRWFGLVRYQAIEQRYKQGA